MASMSPRCTNPEIPSPSSLLPSPRSLSSNSSTTTTSSSNINNGVHPPKPITRSEPGSPYPTTFVQADTSSFKQVVQMLTGSSKPSAANTSDSPPAKSHAIPPIKSTPKKQQSSGFKLYERRNSLSKNLKISPLIPSFSPNVSGFSPRKPEILSPSILDFPSLALSPVTPLIPDPFDRTGPVLHSEAEEKAIKEKGFYLHPSPATTPRDVEPRLLPLFPTTSPRASGSSSSTTSS
ncbi:VQ motif-containing protein 4-like [Neltuma alba]|uniref:VQ motif-containing protein 4-like n=1 Tax=Neltuma alba TaxID=207710 RepID=UPI0010A35560|nr:VQ motif-containing protein 4-like [Prosopis alba]